MGDCGAMDSANATANFPDCSGTKIRGDGASSLGKVDSNRLHGAAPCNVALNAEAGTPGFGSGVALNFEGDRAPEWIALIPAGAIVRGHDGRTFANPDPSRIVAAFEKRGLHLPIDINHAEFLKAPKGEQSPAAGWIEAIEARAGAIYGRVSWTPTGAAALNAREYRYVSPAIRHDANGLMLELLGAGLVNTPNFTLPALNRESPMFKDLLKKLGLAETATEADAIAALDTLQTSLNAARTPDLNLYVPRADYELALNRATTAETKLTERERAARAAETAALIDDAIKAGKIAPASKDFYVATCASEEGLAAFRKHVQTLPKMFDPAKIEDRQNQQDVALNSEQAEIALTMGIDPKAFAAHLAAQKKD
jgi:phage I-like protein